MNSSGFTLLNSQKMRSLWHGAEGSYFLRQYRLSEFFVVNII